MNRLRSTVVPSWKNLLPQLPEAVVLPRTALSYERILGANDRISLGHIGIGSRGGDLDLIASKLKIQPQRRDDRGLRFVDGEPRKGRRRRTPDYYGRTPRAVQHLEELLAMKDVDGVLISTPEHSHSPILKMAAEAGKDAYVEKPMGNVLAEAKAARDAVLQAKTDRAGRHPTSQRTVPGRSAESRGAAALSAMSAKSRSCGIITARAGAAVLR